MKLFLLDPELPPGRQLHTPPSTYNHWKEYMYQMVMRAINIWLSPLVRLVPPRSQMKQMKASKKEPTVMVRAVERQDGVKMLEPGTSYYIK